jgi:hypothetical protein
MIFAFKNYLLFDNTNIAIGHYRDSLRYLFGPFFPAEYPLPPAGDMDQQITTHSTQMG